MDWEFGISRGKLLYIEWINSKVLLYSTGSYIQYPVINHNGKVFKKRELSSAASSRAQALHQHSDRLQAFRHHGRPLAEVDLLREDPCSTSEHDVHCSYL